MADCPSSSSSSQMQSMPPDFETQFTAECNINETQSDIDMTDTREAEMPLPSFQPQFTFDSSWKSDDDEDKNDVQGSTEGDQSQINIFQDNSLFGDGGMQSSNPKTPESIPETPPFSQAGVMNPPATSPALGESSQRSPSSSQHSSDGVDHGAGSDYDFPPYPYGNPVLDPRLGTQVPGSQSPHDYYGSVEDNEESVSSVHEQRGRGHEFLSESRSVTPEAHGSGYDKYEFRERDRAVATTHLDWDKSGDYDPSAKEGRRPKKADGAESSSSRKRRSGQALQEQDNKPGENGQRRQKKPKTYSLAYARFIGASCMLTVSLNSDAGKEVASRLGGEDNWPFEPYNYVSDEYIAQNWVGAENGDDEGTDGPSRQLRPRKRYVHYGSSCSDEDLLPPIPDPAGIEDDLRNHPAARGCVECRREGKKCSLRESGGSWPCQNCLENHSGEEFIACEFIVPPTKKMPCEECAEGDKECSYNDPDSDHAAACQQCQEGDLTCVASPDIDCLPKRVTYTPPPGETYTPYRPFVACTACRQVKKSCSLKSKQDQPPCRACEKAGIECTFEKLIPTNAGKQKAASKTAGREDAPASSNSAEGGPVRPPGGSVGGMAARTPDSFSLPIRTSSTSSIGGLTRISSSSAARGAAALPPSKKKNPRDSGVAGLAKSATPSSHRAAHTSSSSSSTLPRSRRGVTMSGDGITSFRSGARTVSDAARRIQQEKERERLQARQNRKKDRFTHMNPSSTLKYNPDNAKDYTPPADRDIPASYHVLPPPGPDRPQVMKDADGHTGYVREIVTALPHPVVFDINSSSSPGGDAGGCRFCQQPPSFALLGFSWKKPAVIHWNDGRGYTEIMDGHATFGAAPARMCRACVMARVDVLSCEEHEMESLLPAHWGPVERDERAAAMMQRLMENGISGGGGGNHHHHGGGGEMMDRWCAVCPGAAVWRCCRAQGRDEDEDDEEDELGLIAAAGADQGQEGCGLFLCDDCKVEWEDCDRDLQELLERKLSTEKGVMECRADAGFLLQEGLLMKNVEAELMPGQ
ncbi:C6 zinc finger domain containing protein [Lasiodiplodia theobromae]|uniref:C6 zinc finger domain containing protein n=1 Tax=Lasiodiplodia theobromae TaxID=45133 RepID=UPI0015C3FB29|nr:C6 zinc finger domain containing protein [Lasiodiplodia theobromae]KAF4535804.1 C6 zinc finger domain containing protein [Lasiodiplodia theobromae]